MTSIPTDRKNELHLPSDRSFGVTVSIFFVLFACLPLLSGAEPRYWSFAPAILLSVLAVVKPSALRSANVAWTRFGLLLQQIVNPIVLAILFFGILMPFGFVVRMFRKDLMHLKFDPHVNSYWIRPERNELSVPSMVNRF
jgi:hypothetical protein